MVIEDGTVIRIGDVLLIFESAYSEEGLDTTLVDHSAVYGGAAQIIALREQVARAGPDPSPVLLIGETANGETLRYAVKGKYDPGYGSTSRMISETGIALLESDAPGGIGTPGSILGEALVARLRDHAALTFEVEE